jgi:5-methylcytosine-specific restriction endonuclease McrA
VLKRDGYVCWWCGLPGADSVDHLLPRGHPFRDSVEFMRACHVACNSQRNALQLRAEGKGAYAKRRPQTLRAIDKDDNDYIPPALPTPAPRRRIPRIY